MPYLYMIPNPPYTEFNKRTFTYSFLDCFDLKMGYLYTLVLNVKYCPISRQQQVAAFYFHLLAN